MPRETTLEAIKRLAKHRADAYQVRERLRDRGNAEGVARMNRLINNINQRIGKLLGRRRQR